MNVVQRWVATVGVAGIACIAAVALSQPIAPTTSAQLTATIVLAGAVYVAAVLPLHLRSASGTGHLVTLKEAVLVALLVQAPLGLVPIVGLAVNALESTIRRTAPIKIAYNAAIGGLSAAMAAAFVAVVATPSTSVFVLLIIAAVAANLANIVELVSLAELFRRVDGKPIRQSLADNGFIGQAAGITLMVGVLLGAAVLADPWLSIAAIAAVWLAGIGMRDHGDLVEANAQSLRLHEVTSLVGDVRSLEGLHQAVSAHDGDSEVEPLLASIANVFGASQLHLLVVDAKANMLHRTWGEVAPDAPPSVVVEVATTGERRVVPMAEADGGDDFAAMVAPLAGAEFMGAIGLFGRTGSGTWGARDAALLDVLAGHLTTSLGNRRLLDEVEQERALLALESAKLGDIVNAASDGIALLSPTGIIRTFNPGFEAITGALSARVVGRPWQEVVTARIAGDEQRVGTETWATWFTTKHALEIDLDVQRGSSWRRARCALSPVRGPDGHRDGVVIVARDRTAEAEIEQLKADFVAVVSHELRTPLTPLKGFASTLERRAPDLSPEQIETVAKSMGRQLARLDALVSDLLMVADLDRGAGLQDARPVDLAEVLRGAMETEGIDLDGGVDLRVANDLIVPTDPEAVGRIMRALLSNAVKHGGGPTRISLARWGGSVTFDVTDAGPGIPEDERAVVFDTFRRVGTHMEWSTQGPGLGLAIARGLTARLGGTLELVDRVAGAEFRLTLPGGVAGDQDEPLIQTRPST